MSGARTPRDPLTPTAQGQVEPPHTQRLCKYIIWSSGQMSRPSGQVCFCYAEVFVRSIVEPSGSGVELRVLN